MILMIFKFRGQGHIGAVHENGICGGICPFGTVLIFVVKSHFIFENVIFV